MCHWPQEFKCSFFLHVNLTKRSHVVKIPWETHQRTRLTPDTHLATHYCTDQTIFLRIMPCSRNGKKKSFFYWKSECTLYIEAKCAHIHTHCAATFDGFLFNYILFIGLPFQYNSCVNMFLSHQKYHLGIAVGNPFSWDLSTELKCLLLPGNCDIFSSVFSSPVGAIFNMLLV